MCALIFSASTRIAVAFVAWRPHMAAKNARVCAMEKRMAT